MRKRSDVRNRGKLRKEASWGLHMAVSIPCAVHFAGLELGINPLKSLRLCSFTATLVEFSNILKS